MKIIAKQVDPECQDSNFDSVITFMNNDIVFVGNRDYRSHTTPEYDLLIKYIGNAAYDYAYNITNINDTLLNYGFTNPTGKNWSKPKLHQWRGILEADNLEDDENIIKALNLLTGGNWEFTKIRGYCQSDWQGVYYDSSKWSKDDIKALEIDYFNLGTGYDCYPADDPEDTTYIYVYYDDAKKEISDCYGVKPDEVVIYQFDGYTKTPKYKLVED